MTIVRVVLRQRCPVHWLQNNFSGFTTLAPSLDRLLRGPGALQPSLASVSAVSYKPPTLFLK